MGDSFKLGSWKIPVQISVVKLYLGAVILDHQVKLSAHLMCVHYNIAFDHMGSHLSSKGMFECTAHAVCDQSNFKCFQ